MSTDRMIPVAVDLSLRVLRFNLLSTSHLSWSTNAW